MRGKKEIDLHIDPLPDLIIEIDMTSGSAYKLPIYAVLGVPEVWRYFDKQVFILQLEAPNYIQIEESRALPGLTGSIISRFIEDIEKLERPEWVDSIREWARNHRPAQPYHAT
jgi:hypothetical protein